MIYLLQININYYIKKNIKYNFLHEINFIMKSDLNITFYNL
jgi:hypothetical protein